MNRPQESRLGKKKHAWEANDRHTQSYVSGLKRAFVRKRSRQLSQNPGNQELKNFLGNSYSLVFVEVLVVR